MSPSLPPPPRKLSSSSITSSSSHRYPKINPNSLAASVDPSLLDHNSDDEDIDQALAHLLGQSHISSSYHPHASSAQQHQHSQHHPQCRHHAANTPNVGGTARRLSIASVSSLGSGSYSSFGSNGTHSRRVSQAYLSPLSPALSEPTNPSSGSYFDTVNEEDDDVEKMYFNGSRSNSLSDATATLTSTTAPLALNSNSRNSSHEQEMALAASSLPSCNYCSSVRSNSICSSTTQDDARSNLTGISINTSSIGTIGASYNNTHNDTTNNIYGLGLSSPHGSSHHHSHRDSMSLQEFYDSNRLAVLKEYIPGEVRLRLSYHLDECWFLHFSPSGQYMASTGLDHSILLWQNIVTPEPTIYRTFQFSRSITHVEWSPDGKYLLVNLGFDAGMPVYLTEFSLIDVAAGEIVLTRKHRDGPRDIPVNGIGWMTDSKRFMTATRDGLIHTWNVEGEIVHEMDLGDGKAVDKMCMIPGQNSAVVLMNDSKVEIVSFEGEETRFIDSMSDRPVALAVSPDGSYLSISIKANVDLCRPAQILIYDFSTLSFLRALEADSYINEKFMIMPAFCGPHFEILCAGSENGKLHFWDVETGEVIMVLEEHSKHSGWATFHPTLPGMMASCSDDNHIILWLTKDLSRALQDEDEKWMERRRPEMELPHVDIKKGW